jgi:hypothetical protein
MKRKPETPVAVDEQLDDLTAEVYEGDLHALQELRERSADPKVRRDGIPPAADAEPDGDELHDSLWPLIR